MILFKTWKMDLLAIALFAISATIGYHIGDYVFNQLTEVRFDDYISCRVLPIIISLVVSYWGTIIISLEYKWFRV